MRRLFNDAMISAGALLVLLIALVSIDDRVRDHIAGSMRGASIAGTGAQLGDLGSIMLEAVFDQSVAHAPLTIFAAASVVLVLFMLRT